MYFLPDVLLLPILITVIVFFLIAIVFYSLFGWFTKLVILDASRLSSEFHVILKHNDTALHGV